MPPHQPVRRPVHAMTLPDLRRRLTARRTARHHRLNLERELAAYASTAERLELADALRRHPPEQAAEVARILARQARARQARPYPE